MGLVRAWGDKNEWLVIAGFNKGPIERAENNRDVFVCLPIGGASPLRRPPPFKREWLKRQKKPRGTSPRLLPNLRIRTFNCMPYDTIPEFG